MKTIYLALSLIFASNLLQSQDNFKWEIIDSVTKTKDVLFGDTKLFIANTWKSANDVIQSEDKESGIIILKGADIIKVNHMGGEYVYIYKYTITFKVKDNKFKIELKDVYCDNAFMTGSKYSIVKIQPFEGENCPETGTMKAMGLPKKKAIPMMADFKKSLQNIVDSYVKSMKSKSQTDW